MVPADWAGRRMVIVDNEGNMDQEAVFLENN